MHYTCTYAYRFVRVLIHISIFDTRPGRAKFTKSLGFCFPYVRLQASTTKLHPEIWASGIALHLTPLKSIHAYL